MVSDEWKWRVFIGSLILGLMMVSYKLGEHVGMAKGCPFGGI